MVLNRLIDKLIGTKVDLALSFDGYLICKETMETTVIWVESGLIDTKRMGKDGADTVYVDYLRSTY